MANNIFQKTKAALASAETKYKAIKDNQKANEEEYASAKADMDAALEVNNASAFGKAHERAMLCEYRAAKYADALKDSVLSESEYESIRRIFEGEMHTALSAKYADVLAKLQPVVDILHQIDDITEEAAQVASRALADNGRTNMFRYDVDSPANLMKYINRIADIINEYNHSK